MDFIEKFIENTLFKSRWLLAPLYVGLVGALLILLVKFIEKFIKIIPNILGTPSTELVLAILGLVDIVLVANLLLMIIFSGYENFVSKIDTVEGHVDRPDWMGKVDYSDLKLKLIGSIIAISSIELLKVFIKLEGGSFSEAEQWKVGWLMAIHITFVVSGLLFAIMEKTAHSAKHHDDTNHDEHAIPVAKKEEHAVTPTLASHDESDGANRDSYG